MNDRDLPNIAQNAIELVLGYHAGSDKKLTEADKTLVEDRINALLLLKPLADDPDVANIEIVSDAAVTFLDVYNEENPESPIIQKWFYVSVQALTSIQLKPAFVDGDVARLIAPSEMAAVHAHEDPVADHDEESQPDKASQPDEASQPDQAETSAEVAPKVKYRDILPRPSPVDTLPLPLPVDDDEPQDEEAADETYEPAAERARKYRKRRSNGPSVAKGKEPWTDDDIRLLIKFKIQRRTHKDIATTLGRTEPACAIRHSIVLREARWREFAREYRAKRDAGETSDAEAETKESQDGEDATEINAMLEIEQVQEDGDSKDIAEKREDGNMRENHEATDN